jgi:hypothetical protein
VASPRLRFTALALFSASWQHWSHNFTKSETSTKNQKKADMPSRRTTTTTRTMLPVAQAQLVGTLPANAHADSEFYKQNAAEAATYSTIETPIVSATWAKDDSIEVNKQYSQPIHPIGTVASFATKPTQGCPTTFTTTTTTTTTYYPSPRPTGNQVLRSMKEDRKKRTVTAGVVGGIVGLFILGPLGAVVIGVTSAVVTKHSGKSRERRVRKQLEREGLLNQPVVVSRYIRC